MSIYLYKKKLRKKKLNMDDIEFKRRRQNVFSLFCFNPCQNYMDTNSYNPRSTINFYKFVRSKFYNIISVFTKWTQTKIIYLKFHAKLSTSLLFKYRKSFKSSNSSLFSNPHNNPNNNNCSFSRPHFRIILMTAN